MKLAAAVFFIGVAVFPASEPEDGPKLMLAASVLLSKTMETPVSITVLNYELAIGKSLKGFDFQDVHFQKVASCLYAETYRSGKSGRYMTIDFGKLSGRFVRNGISTVFYGSKDMVCYGSDKSSSPKCLDRMIANTMEAGRVIDNARYMLDHGCGNAARNDPY